MNIYQRIVLMVWIWAAVAFILQWLWSWGRRRYDEQIRTDWIRDKDRLCKRDWA